MEMVVPHILVAGRPVVLAGGDSFATEGVAHRKCQAARSPEELAAKVVRDVQQVLVVSPGNYQAVALYPRVMMGRNQRENIGIDQDDGRFRSGRWKRSGDTAERTFVSGRGVLHWVRCLCRAAPANGIGLDELSGAATRSGCVGLSRANAATPDSLPGRGGADALRWLKERKPAANSARAFAHRSRSPEGSASNERPVPWIVPPQPGQMAGKSRWVAALKLPWQSRRAWVIKHFGTGMWPLLLKRPTLDSSCDAKWRRPGRIIRTCADDIGCLSGYCDRSRLCGKSPGPPNNGRRDPMRGGALPPVGAAVTCWSGLWRYRANDRSNVP